MAGIRFLKINEADSPKFVEWGGIIYTTTTPICDMWFEYSEEAKKAGKYPIYIETFVIYVDGDESLKCRINSMKIGDIIVVDCWQVKKISEHFVRVWKK